MIARAPRRRRQWRTCQRSARRADRRLQRGDLLPALPRGQRATLCTALAIWHDCGCPQTFVPVAERIARETGWSARSVRRHLRALAAHGHLRMVEPAVAPRLLDRRHEGRGWVRVAPGLAAAYELNFDTLELQHMDARHRSRPGPSEPTSACGSTQGPCSKTSLGGHLRQAVGSEPSSPGAVHAVWGPRRDPPERRGPPDDELVAPPWRGLAQRDGRWVVVFPMTEGAHLAQATPVGPP